MLLNYLFNFKIKKKREILRGSYFSDSLLENFFKKLLNYEELRTIFFKKNIFAYNDDDEKEKILECLNKHCSNKIKQYINLACKVINKEFTIFEKDYQFKKI